jgi:hypothetical protein
MKILFAKTIQHDEDTIQGLRVDYLEVEILEVSSLPRNGVEFPIKENVVAARDEFREPREKLDSSSQGTKGLSFP